MADIAKPMRGFASSVFELRYRFRGNALRVVYAVQIGEKIWDPRIPEEVEQGNQDTQARVGSYKSAAEMDT